MEETERRPARRGPGLVSAFLTLASSHLVRTFAGFVFWVVVARVAPTTAVGVAGAVIAAVSLLSRFTSLGLGSFMMAELPRLPAEGARELFRLGTTVLVAVCVPVTLLYAGVVLLLADDGSSVHDTVDTLLVAALFLATMVLTTVTGVWDYGALGLGRSSAQLTRNLVASFGRFPVLLAWPVLVGEVDAAAILTAWVAPIAVSAVVFRLQVGLAGGPRSGRRRSAELLVTHWRTSLGHWFLDVALAIGPLLVPVVAAAVLDPRDNGWFTVAWMAASVVFVAPFALATSLFASSARSGPEAFLHSCRRVLPAGVGLCTGGVLGTWLLGSLVFRVFGSDYVEQSLPVMSVLVLGGYWMVFKDLLLDWQRLERRFVAATTVASVSTVLDVVGAVAGGVLLGGAHGVAVGWVVSSGVQALLASPLVVDFIRRVLASRAPLPG